MKKVYFTLDCGYRVAAKVRTVRKEDGGIITIVSAKFPSVFRILIDKLDTPKYFFLHWTTEELENSYGKEIRGKAFCMPVDVYNEEYGIDIATKRLQFKMNVMVNNRLRKVRKELERTLNNKLFHLDDIDV